MKKKLLSTTLILFTIFFKTFGQLDLKLNTVGLANKKIEFSAEAGYDRFSMEILLGYSFKPWGDGISINEEDISVPRSGMLYGFRPNFYFKPKTSLDGFYSSPYITYNRLTLKEEQPVLQNKLSTGLLIGRKGKIYQQFYYLAELGLGYNAIYSYKNKVTKEKEFYEESIPFFGGLTKINIPFRVSVIYRIGES